jgi:multiple sugar transport system permease protein
MSTRRGRAIRHNIFLYGMLAIAITFLCFPVYWMVKSSLTPVEKILTKDVSLGITELDVSSYVKVWTGTDYAAKLKMREYLWNSLVVVGISTFISIVFATLGGYSLARFKYKRRETIAQGILYVYMFPQMILTTPLLMLVIKLGLYNKLWSLIIVFCTFSLPYSIWMMRSYFNELPRELEEAAMVDGCNRVQAIWKVMFPLAMPGVAATVTYSFIIGWSNVIYPLSFVTDESKKLVSIGFLSLVSGDQTPWNGVMASAVISSIPVVLIFMFFQRYLVAGLASGGVKS